MSYISPLALVDIADQPITPQKLLLAKRKMLAEFELQEATTIEVNGTELSRNDVLELFKQLEQEKHFDYHQLVASDPKLLYFLEHGQLEYKEKFTLSSYHVTPEFLAWISPYFKKAFIQCSTTTLRNHDMYSFVTLMMNPVYVTPQDEYAIWEPIHQEITIVCNRLSEISNLASPYPAMQEIKTLTGPEQMGIIKSLPQEHFAEQIDTYAFNVMCVTVGIFNKIDKDWAVEILESCQSIPASNATRDDILNKKNEMNRIRYASAETANSSDSGTSWGTIRLILFIIFIILRIATCNA